MVSSDNQNTSPMRDGKRVSADSIVLDIDRVLEEEAPTSALLHEAATNIDWAMKLEALHDYSALVELRIHKKEMTHAEGVEALDDFLAFLSGE